MSTLRPSTAVCLPINLSLKVQKPESGNYTRKDGLCGFLVMLVVTSMHDGVLNGYLGIAVDITERKAAEKELLRA